jgi:hypothetical protein
MKYPSLDEVLLPAVAVGSPSCYSPDLGRIASSRGRCLWIDKLKCRGGKFRGVSRWSFMQDGDMGQSHGADTCRGVYWTVKRETVNYAWHLGGHVGRPALMSATFPHSNFVCAFWARIHDRLDA